MTGRWLAAVLLAAALVGGCQPDPISLRAGTRSFTESDYQRVYRAWTRDEQDFSWTRLTDVLRVTATFESWEFRWAYVIRYAHDYSIQADARDRMLRATLQDAQRNHRFLVSMIGSEFDESVLTRPQTAWRVLLIDEHGRQTPPSSIERIRRPTAADRVYFESIDPQREAFRVQFPAVRDDGLPSIPPDAHQVTLRFTGARGRVDLVWEFEPLEPGTSGGESPEMPVVPPADEGDAETAEEPAVEGGEDGAAE